MPLWWDEGTLEDVKAWKRESEQRGAKSREPFICCLWPKRYGGTLIRYTIRERFRTACKPLGFERLRSLTVYHGRRTFVSHALAGGRMLAEVKATAGHTSLVTTSV